MPLALSCSRHFHGFHHDGITNSYEKDIFGGIACEIVGDIGTRTDVWKGSCFLSHSVRKYWVAKWQRLWPREVIYGLCEDSGRTMLWQQPNNKYRKRERGNYHIWAYRSSIRRVIIKLNPYRFVADSSQMTLITLIPGLWSWLWCQTIKRRNLQAAYYSQGVYVGWSRDLLV